MTTDKSRGPDQPAYLAAQAIHAAYDHYQTDFIAITRRAKARFEARDGTGAQQDARQRLDLYKAAIDVVVSQIGQILGDNRTDSKHWAQMKVIYAQLRQAYPNDFELAQTFFNSVTRRVFHTSGVQAEIEFVDADFNLLSSASLDPLYQTYRLQTSLPELFTKVYADFPFSPGYADLPHDAEIVADEVRTFLQGRCKSEAFDRIEFLRPVFYRGSGAYLIGRICRSAYSLEPLDVPTTSIEALRAQYVPLILCLVNPTGKIVTDAVLLDEDEASIVFSFAHSYFHVEVNRPRELVNFLKSILPLKRIAELYISIGYNKHGKTELYRDLMHHLANSHDQFEIARGEKGMVMCVFTLPSYDLVFKVIKDKILPPKTATRQQVESRYDLVFRHDRAGRLVDAQEFEHLKIDQARFSDELLQELQETAPSIVTVEGGYVSIQHLYTERRLTPLNLYIQEPGEHDLQEVVIDYGKAIKDMAVTNIFPGDILLKNFGVTRHGRVVFYDYDELCLVTDCKFRRVPQATYFDDEFSAEPWYYVGPMDIFPQEFLTFLGLQGELRATFIEHHADLFGVEYWKSIQAIHRSGGIIDIYPYPDSKHLFVGIATKLAESLGGAASATPRRW